MTTLVDLWRAVDPAARLLTPADDAAAVVVRGVARTRVAPPHLPPMGERQLLVVDGGVLGDDPLDVLLTALTEVELSPVAVLLAVAGQRAVAPHAPATVPILVTELPAAAIATRADRYLDDERGTLDRFTAELRLAAAETALADPTPAAPAGLVATRIRRGVAVTAEGELIALHARPAGHALAARFTAALRATLLEGTARRGAVRHTRDGLWVHEASIRPSSSVWIYDDVPLAAIDLAAAQALTLTLRALLRRPPAPSRSRDDIDRQPPATGEVVADTMLAVARANGRVAPAARALGVHRNTVLYRLQRARVELGVDPRRPDDALRILRADEERRRA